jgi:hypothetical protein
MNARGWLLFVACLAGAAECRQTDRSQRSDRIDLHQNVTNERRPQDKIFNDFEKNWRQFISPSAELALPVVAAKESRQPWEPDVVPECVSSADAGGLGPQVTLTWTEPAPDTPASPPVGPSGAQGLRLDLALHHEGFARGYFSSILASNTQQRFMLPSNGAIVKDPEAVLLTGPGLFPKLTDFRVEGVQDRAESRRLERYTVVLRELSPGLTYTIRVSRRAGDSWMAVRQSVFLTPVCPR